MPSFSHSLRLPVAVAALAAAAALAVPTAGAIGRPSACKYLTAGQLASVHVGTACTVKSLPFSQGGIPVARLTTVEWGSFGKGVVRLDIYAVKPAYVSAAKTYLTRQGGTPVKVGSWGLFQGFSNGKTGARIIFGVGNDVVGVSVDTAASHPLHSQQQVIALATGVAAHL